MKIVHVTPFYQPIIGGVENVAQQIAEYMASGSNEVHVLTYNRLRDGKANNLPTKETINNVNVIRVKPNFAWNHGTYSSELPKKLRELKPDLVHVHAWRHPHVFQVAKLKNELGFKAILHSHGPFHKLNQLGIVSWTYHKTIDWTRKSALKKYDVLIALTPHEKDLLIKRLGAKEQQISVIPNGIPEEILKDNYISDWDSPIVLYLGRISKSKNVNLLVKAMKYVDPKLALTLVMAGPDEGLAKKLERYALEHNINLKYLGAISDEEKIALYKQCSIFAHPALYEPYGITLLEAQAFGKPCIITGEGGQVFVAPPGKTSLYVKPDPIIMGQAISSLLNDKLLYKQLSENAQKLASENTWSKILPKYDVIYGLT